MWQPNNQIILWFSKAISFGWLAMGIGGGGGGSGGATGEQSRRRSKLRVKTNILNAKFDFLHSKDFKLDSRI
jgi:hypothetical protein